MARLTDAARQLDDGLLKTAAAIIEVLAATERVLDRATRPRRP
jgi:hypothetical protein